MGEPPEVSKGRKKGKRKLSEHLEFAGSFGEMIMIIITTTTSSCFPLSLHVNSV